MKLSLIICVYNTDKKYLEECLLSIRNSTLPYEDYEIVFVDDGSSVDYSDMVSLFGVKYVKIENGGLLAARVVGINNASGDYIAFVDSDDTVSRNYHLPMLFAAEKHNADIVMNGWAFHTVKGKRCCINDASMSTDGALIGNRLVEFYTAQRGTDHSLYVQWNKLFKKEVLLKTVEQISKTDVLTRRITFGEDVYLNFFNFKNSRCIVSINSGFYFYRIHPEQSVVISGKKTLLTHVQSMKYIFDTMYENTPDADSVVIGNIRAWSELISRTHYSAARAAKYTDLYPIIKEAYGVSRLRLSLLKDSKIYIASELLGKNYDEIDLALTSLYEKKGNAVRYGGRSYYQHRIVYSYSKLYDKDVTIGEGIFIPKKKNRLIDVIVHNKYIYAIGCVLFKKGSKIRSFLKNRL